MNPTNSAMVSAACSMPAPRDYPAHCAIPADDAAFAPFRYFDIFDEASGIAFFSTTPKLLAWRQALSQHPSVRKAVSADYPSLLRQLVLDQNGVLAGRFALKNAA